MKLLHIAGSVCRHPTRATLLIFLAIVTYMATFQSDLSSYYEQIKHDIEKRQSSQSYIVSKIHNIMMVIPNSYGIFAVWVIEMCGVEKLREIKIFCENHYLVVDLHVYRAC